MTTVNNQCNFLPTSVACLSLALCLTPALAEPQTADPTDPTNPLSYDLPFAHPDGAFALTTDASSSESPSVIIENSPHIERKRGFDIFEYLNISILGGGSAGFSTARRFAYTRIGGQYSSGKVSIKGNYLYTDISSRLALELKNELAEMKERCFIDAQFQGISNQCPYLRSKEDRLTYKFLYEHSGLDELYAQITLSDNLNLTIGKNRVTWGQFAVASPVHFLLPINTEQQLGFSKVDARQPQPVIQLLYYPIESLSVEMTYITETELSPEQEEYFARVFRGDLENESSDFETRYAPGYDASKNAAQQFATHSQTALRTVYQPAWGVIGLTLWRGPLHFDIVRNGTIYCGNFSRNYCDTSDQKIPPGEAPAYADDYFRTIAPDLGTTSALGFEIGINLKNWVLIGEWAYVDNFTSTVPTTTALDAAIKTCGNPGGFLDFICELERRDAHVFLQTLGRTHAGQDSFLDNGHIIAIGADGSSSNGSWTYNLEILGLIFERSDALDPLAELSLRFDSALEERVRSGTREFYLPTIHIVHSHTFMNRSANWGVAMGFFLQYGGILSYYNVDVSNNASIQFGVELVQRTSEGGAALEAYTDYQLQGETSLAVSTAIQFKF